MFKLCTSTCEAGPAHRLGEGCVLIDSKVPPKEELLLMRVIQEMSQANRLLLFHTDTDVHSKS